MSCKTRIIEFAISAVLAYYIPASALDADVLCDLRFEGDITNDPEVPSETKTCWDNIVIQFTTNGLSTSMQDDDIKVFYKTPYDDADDPWHHIDNSRLFVAQPHWASDGAYQKIAAYLPNSCDATEGYRFMSLEPRSALSLFGNGINGVVKIYLECLTKIGERRQAYGNITVNTVSELCAPIEQDPSIGTCVGCKMQPGDQFVNAIGFPYATKILMGNSNLRASRIVLSVAVDAMISNLSVLQMETFGLRIIGQWVDGHGTVQNCSAVIPRITYLGDANKWTLQAGDRQKLDAYLYDHQPACASSKTGIVYSTQKALVDDLVKPLESNPNFANVTTVYLQPYMVNCNKYKVPADFCQKQRLQVCDLHEVNSCSILDRRHSAGKRR